MSSLPVTRCTPEQYLEMERQADHKSEYYGGEIFARAGASEAHNLVVTNLVGELSARLKGHPCKTYPSDMKVEVGPAGLFTYPDVTVVCGETRFHDDRRDMVQNPTVLVEVLSPSTEAYDRGEKFVQYRRLPTLTDYLMVSTTERRIEHYVRQTDNQWLLSEITNPEAAVILATLGCELPLSEIYDRVE